MKAFALNLTADLVKLIAEIDEFKGRWHAVQHHSPEYLQALRNTAAVDSVCAAIRTPGARLTEARAQVLLSDLAHASQLPQDEQEVASYAETLNLVYEDHAELTLTESHIRQLHQAILNHSKDERYRGTYKMLPNSMVAYDAQGEEVGVIFAATTPFNTPREMRELVAWAVKAIYEETMHPLVVIAIFVAVFLSIQPFQVANERLSRVLALLLLLRAGYSYMPYISLERVMEANRDAYYAALKHTQTTLRNDEPDWQPWLGFFLHCLKQQKDSLADYLDSELFSATSGEAEWVDEIDEMDDLALPELSAQVLDLLRIHERQTIAQLQQATGANRSTLKLRVRELVSAGRIRRHGKARATWYTL